MTSYRDRRVLVIGGFGYLGGNLTAHLHGLGARVTVVTRSVTGRSDSVGDCERRGIAVVEGDLRDQRAMGEAVEGQEIVFNLAGQSGAVQSLEDPWTDLDVNVRGNLVLLEALRLVNPAAKVIFVGSRLAYGRAGSQPVSEDHATDPLCLHAIHKLTVEAYLELYGKLFGLRFAVARVTNPYGPGQPADRTAYGVVNRMVHVALQNGVVTVYGDGAQRRDYVYVDDVSRALARLGEADASTGRVYNVGTGIGTRLVDMANRIVELAGRGRVESVAWPALAEQIETGDFVADISRIERDVEWRPRVSLDEGLSRTIGHYLGRRVEASSVANVES